MISQIMKELDRNGLLRFNNGTKDDTDAVSVWN